MPTIHLTWPMVEHFVVTHLAAIRLTRPAPLYGVIAALLLWITGRHRFRLTTTVIGMLGWLSSALLGLLGVALALAIRAASRPSSQHRIADGLAAAGATLAVAAGTYAWLHPATRTHIATVGIPLALVLAITITLIRSDRSRLRIPRRHGASPRPEQGDRFDSDEDWDQEPQSDHA